MASSPFALNPFIAQGTTFGTVLDVRAPVTPPTTPGITGNGASGGTTGPSVHPPGPISAGFFGDFADAILGGQSFGEFAGGFIGDQLAGGPCPPGRIRVGELCFDPSAALPGGVPLAVPASGAVLNGSGSPAVVGAFGIPARQPVVVAQPTRRCPTGMVLGKDLLCYMKGTIGPKFRRWKPAPKPPMSAADAKALRRIGSLQTKVKRLAKSANLTCKRK